MRKHKFLNKKDTIIRLKYLFIITLFMCMPNLLFAQISKINLSVRSVTLKELLAEIEKKSEIHFSYIDQTLDNRKNITLAATDESVESILNRVLPGQGFEYVRTGNTIAIKPKAESETQQNPLKKVTGTVTDEKGEPIIGASVILKGTSSGAATDMDGRFSLDVPDNGVLQFSYLGYNTREVSVSGRSEVNVQLTENLQSLDEVVVVGYGTQRKSDLTGSISVLKSEDILAVQQFNALDGLRGKAAGVSVQSSTGNPLGLDGEGQRVTIRGISSINTSSSPLYVVDGVQMTNFHTINPNDIERMEVLKDASATAIYGARGANGVILVTTKRGNVGEGRTVVSYNANVSMGTLAKKVKLMNAAEFLEIEDIAFQNLSKYPTGRTTLVRNGYAHYDSEGNFVLDKQWVPRRTDPLIFDQNGKPLYDTDWQEEVTRNAISHNHQLSVQYQGTRASAGAFLSYSDNQGIMLNNYGKRVSARMVFDAKPKKWLDINTNLSVNYQWGNTIDDTSGAGNARRTIWEMQPIIPVKYPDGRWGSTSYLTQSEYSLEGMANPVQELTTATRKRVNSKVFGNSALVFHIADGLDLRTQFGIDFSEGSVYIYLPNDLAYISQTTNGQASIRYGNNIYWQEETYLTYNKILKDIHRTTFMVGLSWSEFQSLTFNPSNVTGFGTNQYLYYNLGAGTTQGSQQSSGSRSAINSYFGRLNYVLKDKYMLTATLRLDGSSRFGVNNKYALFPSAGLGWTLSSEDFMKDISWIDNLKIRTSYGRTGNQEIPNYRSLAMVTGSTVLLNGTRATSAEQERMANPDLQWEKTDLLDVGFEIKLLKNRFNLEFSFYNKKTSDLLLDSPIPYETGFSTIYRNIGSVQNRGIDLLINTINVKTPDFSWETTLNLNYNKNKILKLGENDEDIVIGSGAGTGVNVIHRVGYPIGSFYTYKRLGTWSTEEAEEAAQYNQVPGESKKSTERFVFGSGNPDWTGSFINKFSYKNLDLLVDLQFVHGIQVFEAYLGTIADRAGVSNGFKMMLTEGWREDRQNTMVQQIRHSALSGQSSAADSWWLADGSYIRGNLLQLGYTFNKKSLAAMGLQRMRINFSVGNAFLIHSKEFRSYDPEASSSTGRWGQNTFFFQYPTARTFSLGANITF